MPLFRSASLVASLAILTAACSDAGVSSSRGPQVVSGSYSGYNYRLFVPSGYESGTSAPLLVMLHGCLQGADDFAAATGMNTVAEANRFLVVYPEQKTAVNPARCWQWWEPANQARGSGEAGLLAGLLRQVAGAYTIDTERTYLLGFSAGGGLAALGAALYPDLFAAAVISSGLEYKAAMDLTGSFAAMRAGGPNPLQQGQLAYQAMGPRARLQPVLVFHGGADSIVATTNGHQVLAQWAQTNDLADNGADDNSVSDTPTEMMPGQVPGGRSFTRSRYRDAGGQVALEKYIIDGMSHAWPAGGTGGGGSYSDRGAPDGAQLSWAFLRAYDRSGGSADGGAAEDLQPLADLRPTEDGPIADLSQPDLAQADGGGDAQFASIGAEDGYAGQLWVDGASTLLHRVGDKGFFNRDSYRLILSFDTSAIPHDATIRGARLRLTRRSLVGNVSALSLDIRSGAFGRGEGLAQDDYGALASQDAVATAAPPGSDGATVTLVLSPTALRHINKGGRSQLRLRATTTPGFSANVLQVYGGEDGANAPTLTIDY